MVLLPKTAEMELNFETQRKKKACCMLESEEEEDGSSQSSSAGGDDNDNSVEEDLYSMYSETDMSTVLPVALEGDIRNSGVHCRFFIVIHRKNGFTQ